MLFFLAQLQDEHCWFYQKVLPGRSLIISYCAKMPENILIIGATGLIGTPITRAIVDAKSNFGRIAILTSNTTLTNKASEISSLKSSGVEVLTGDLTNEEDVKQAYKGRYSELVRSVMGHTCNVKLLQPFLCASSQGPLHGLKSNQLPLQTSPP